MSQFLIRGGIVYDGTGSTGRAVDVRVSDGTIGEIGLRLELLPGEKVVDAAGLLVVPGLIDLHVHVFTGIGMWSVPPSEIGLKTGVTTLLDTGTAGALTYEGFERLVIEQAQEDIFALLNISIIGCLQGGPDSEPFMGELSDTRYAHVQSAIDCIRKHPERIVGLKARLTGVLADEDPVKERAGFDAILEVANTVGLPLMFHHAASTIPLKDVLSAMRPGDIYTHLYHQAPDGGFIDERSVALMREARARGVIFDVGHGKGAYAWEVAERATAIMEFWPDTISSDLHSFNIHGPVFDMPTTMSKLLYLGMPLEKVIQASTYNPARAMRLENRFGLLETGRQADITLLQLEVGDFQLLDVRDEVRHAKQRLRAVQVFKRGEIFDCG